ncbi:MAG: hypothetical protein ACRDS0_00950 [Pseudonocardiaceae bacterium]
MHDNGWTRWGGRVERHPADSAIYGARLAEEAGIPTTRYVVNGITVHTN